MSTFVICFGQSKPRTTGSLPRTLTCVVLPPPPEGGTRLRQIVFLVLVLCNFRSRYLESVINNAPPTHRPNRKSKIIERDAAWSTSRDRGPANTDTILATRHPRRVAEAGRGFLFMDFKPN